MRALPLPLLLALACQPGATVVRGLDLVEAPAANDGKRIVLVGVVENPRKQMPATGSTFTSFTIADGTARVPVIAWGTEPVDGGDLVEVRGIFRDRMEAGGEVLDNVVEAQFVRALRKAGQLPGTPAGPP